MNDPPSEGAEKYLLATSDFGKGMQGDINMYVVCNILKKHKL